MSAVAALILRVMDAAVRRSSWIFSVLVTHSAGQAWAVFRRLRVRR